ncbi:MAG: HAMP domain-containing histidine kinase [Gemmataceae bacterium]|nr:HAMP domain-containing histidine kinase [Gemmataceae bacterium]
MKLSNRLALFHLATLAGVLLCFSAAIYGLTRWHLIKQIDDLTGTTLDTLMAIVEVEPDGLEWERHNRPLFERNERLLLVWAVYDEKGHRIDGSENLPDWLNSVIDMDTPPLGQQQKQLTREGQTWQLVWRAVHHPDSFEIPDRPRPDRYQRLIFVTALPVTPVFEWLRTLAWSLVGVSLGLVGLIALSSRWLSRRALAPVTRMIDAAKQISATNWEQKLPLSSSRDELYDLAVSFNDLLSRLHDAYLRQERFTAEASHQLRTPLTALRGQFEVALRRDREACEYRRVLAGGITQVERLSQIVESLLYLARADHELDKPERMLVTLSEWLPMHIQTSWGNHSHYSRLQLVIPNNDPMLLKVEPVLLGQALDNLIDNALKYSPADCPVHVTLSRQEKTLIIVVEDQGTGIPSEELKQVFEPFFRSSLSRRLGLPGVGLGLATSSRLIQTLGGSLQLLRHEHGCTFAILFQV